MPGENRMKEFEPGPVRQNAVGLPLAPPPQFSLESPNFYTGVAFV